MAGRDRLDGTDRHHFLLEAFLLPGRIILWINYMAPGRNVTIASGRRARSPLFTLITAVMFWAVAIFLISMILFGEPAGPYPVQN